ncbi:hypothetical protein SDJN02_09462 [Cucurbita argyrosperma subsp. argyrosperma]|nr:hypothetical protein SDJN02_09462 [Cucurbita argyrosperma subsp. argyrosperma]
MNSITFLSGHGFWLLLLENIQILSCFRLLLRHFMILAGYIGRLRPHFFRILKGNYCSWSIEVTETFW